MSAVLSQDGYVLIKTQQAKGVYADPGVESANAVFVVTRTATGGTFKAVVNGTPTAGITAAAALTAATFQGALELVVGAGNVTVTGADGGPFTVEFTELMGNQTVTFTIDAALATGGTVSRTVTDAGASKGIGIRIRGGALGGARELMTPDPEIGGNRDIPDAKMGPIRFEGEYQAYLRMVAVTTLLQAALCCKTRTVNSGSVDDGFTHEMFPGSEQVWLSIEEQIGNGFERFKYTDVVVNTLHLEASADGYLMMNAGLIGLRQAVLGVGTELVEQQWDLTPLLVGANVLVTRGGVQLPGKTFSLDINNNFENDDFRLGSLYLGNLQPKRREVNMSVTIRPEDSSYWREATWGSAVATAPTGLSTKDDTLITIESWEDVANIAAPGTPYSLEVNVPQSIIKPFSLNPNGDDVLQHDMEIMSVRPDPLVDILTATVVNDVPVVP